MAAEREADAGARARHRAVCWTVLALLVAVLPMLVAAIARQRGLVRVHDALGRQLDVQLHTAQLESLRRLQHAAAQAQVEVLALGLDRQAPSYDSPTAARFRADLRRRDAYSGRLHAGEKARKWLANRRAHGDEIDARTLASLRLQRRTGLLRLARAQRVQFDSQRTRENALVDAYELLARRVDHLLDLASESPRRSELWQHLRRRAGQTESIDVLACRTWLWSRGCRAQQMDLPEWSIERLARTVRAHRLEVEVWIDRFALRG